AADICLHNGQVVVAVGNGLYSVGDADLTLLAEGGGPLVGAASYSGTVYVHDGSRVGLLEGDELVYTDITDWGSLPYGSTVRDMMAHGSRLYFATDEGIALLRGMTWYTITGEQGLCYEDTTCLATGFDRDLWFGTMRGAIRNVDDAYQFFGYER